jgi:hypothetical protein
MRARARKWKFSIVWDHGEQPQALKLDDYDEYTAGANAACRPAAWHGAFMGFPQESLSVIEPSVASACRGEGGASGDGVVRCGRACDGTWHATDAWAFELNIPGYTCWYGIYQDIPVYTTPDFPIPGIAAVIAQSRGTDSR